MNFHLPYKLLLLTGAASLLTGYFFTYGQFLYAPYSGASALIVVLGGVALGMWAKRTILKHETTFNPYGHPTHLVTTGPFRFSRNPMYVSYVLVALGFALYTGVIAALIFPVLYFLYLHLRIIPLEERKLRERFTSEYVAYTQSTRRWV